MSVCISSRIAGEWQTGPRGAAMSAPDPAGRDRRRRGRRGARRRPPAARDARARRPGDRPDRPHRRLRRRRRLRRPTDPLHLLNVPAVRMGGDPGRPEHFHEWLLERGEPVRRGSVHVARPLRHLHPRPAGQRRARGHRRPPAPPLRRGHRDRRAARRRRPAPLELSLADGERIEADRVILALGPLGAGDPIPVPAELKESGVYVADPWAPGALDDGAPRPRGADRRHRPLDGRRRADPRRGRRRAARPRGLPPRPGAAPPPPHLTNLRRFHIPTETGELEPMVAAIFAQICRVAQQGDDWRDVIDSMRPVTPALWKALAHRGAAPLPGRVPAALGRPPLPHGARGGRPLRGAAGRRADPHRVEARSSRWSRTATASASSCAAPARPISTRSRWTG